MATLTLGVVLTTASAPIAGVFNRYNGAGPLTISLPLLAGLNEGVRFAVQNLSAYTVTFNCAGADTFDNGTGSITVDGPGMQRELQVVLDNVTKRWKSVGPLGVDTSAAALSNTPNVVTTGIFYVIPAGYSNYLPGYMEIASGASYELPSTSILEIG